MDLLVIVGGTLLLAVLAVWLGHDSRDFGRRAWW